MSGNSSRLYGLTQGIITMRTGMIHAKVLREPRAWLPQLRKRVMRTNGDFTSAKPPRHYGDRFVFGKLAVRDSLLRSREPSAFVSIAEVTVYLLGRYFVDDEQLPVR
jgi:hypothetical protein